MAEAIGVPAQQRVEYKDWGGLIFDIDPTDLPPGVAQDQMNAVGYDAAQIQSRLGIREISFDSD